MLTVYLGPKYNFLQFTSENIELMNKTKLYIIFYYW